MEKGYLVTTPPSRWEEAALCGNGVIGAIAMCDPLRETIILSHERLFLPQNPKLPPPDTGSHLGEIRAMLAAGEYGRAARTVVKLSEAEGYTGLRWTDSFLPACDLTIRLADAGAVSEYRRELDFTTGLAGVAWSDSRGTVRREWFVSRADGAVVLRLSADGGLLDGSVDLMRHPPDDLARWLRGEDRHLDRFARVERDVRIEDGPGGEAGVLELACGFHGVEFGYACSVRILAPGGRLAVQNGEVAFEATREILLLATVEYRSAPPAADPRLPSRALAGLPSGFQPLFNCHAAVHGEIYNRLDLTLADDCADGVLERLFHAGRYHILASAGETPPNLQGIWTGTYTVPWSSDYTQNGNTQTAILGLLPGNMAGSLLSYFDYQESLLPDFRENARRLYGCRGIHLPSRTSNHGFDSHFNENWCHTFWTAGAGWAAHFYYDYWLYTGDRGFFMQRALPFMKEAALFYEDFLIEDATGHWMFSPSYSPENNPAGIEAQACVNATMDIAVARELFGNLIEGCTTLGVEADSIEGWRRMLAKMPPYRINADGALQEWCHDGLEDRYDHRHASHLYPLFYGVAREIRESPELFEACAQAYRLRLRERKKEFGIMAFGLIQLGFAAVHLGDAPTADRILRTLAGGYYYRNFASSHDAGPQTFNVDIAGGLPALVMETVVQSHPRQGPDGAVVSFELQLLPCVPESLHTGRLKGVRARGGFELDIEWADGLLIRADVKNPLGSRCVAVYAGKQVRPDAFDRRTFTPEDFK